MLNFGVELIILLLLIGGIIAISGNYIGKTLGRRRVTIFRLRPRYTAYIITTISGILIVLITLLTMLALSQDARTALFGLAGLKNELSQKSKQAAEAKNEIELINNERKKVSDELEGVKSKLESAREEINSLEKIKQRLGKEIELSRKGKVLFNNGEVLLSSLIQAGPEKEKLSAGIKNILSAADSYVRSFGVKEAKHLILLPEDDFDQAVAALQTRTGTNIIRVIATQNTLFGEVVPIRLEILENKLIYKADTPLEQISISPTLPLPDIEREIRQLLFSTHAKARENGILPDAGGSIGSIPYSQITALAKKIKESRKEVKVAILAKNAIYAAGPLEITFKIFYK